MNTEIITTSLSVIGSVAGTVAQMPEVKSCFKQVFLIIKNKIVPRQVVTNISLS